MTSVNGLDSYFISLINNLMLLERQPLNRLTTQRDNINQRTAVYNDVDTKLSELQSSVYSLISSGYSYEFEASRSTAISDQPTGKTVFSATASSTAVTGTYQIENITLAKEHRVRSDQQAYIDQALGLSTGTGYIVMGGADARSASEVAEIADTVTSFATTSVDSGKTELGKGTYSIEVRQDATEGWQFRILDSDGLAVSIRNGTSATDMTSNWQSILTGGGTFNTGRGLTINFEDGDPSYTAGSVAAGNAAQVSYVSQGAHIEISATDSLNTIAGKINDATYASKDGVVATIVDRKLILSSASTGTAHALSVTNLIDNGAGGLTGVLHDLGILAEAGTGFKNAVLQPAANAQFDVNGITVTRSSHEGLTDVISGVTLSLAADAEGSSATLSVNKDLTNAKAAVNTFIKNYNSLQTYLDSKTTVSATTTDAGVTVNRGALADDYVFSELRTSMFTKFMDEYSTSGKYKSLRDIGLTIDDNLQATISDSAKFEEALESDLEGVQALMDEVMGEFDTTLDRFTGTRESSSYITSALQMLGTEMTDVNTDIDQMNEFLVNREDYLVNQYGQLQAQLVSLSYAQQMWASIYGSYNRTG